MIYTNHAVVSNGSGAFSVAVSGERYDDLVAAASSAVAQLSAEIARDLSGLESGE